MEWDNYYQEPTYQSTMPVLHTPPKSEESDPRFLSWKVLINGTEEIVQVNEEDNQYLSLPSTTEEQRSKLLTAIWEKASSAAAAAAMNIVSPEDLNPSKVTPANTPTSTEEDLEEIEERTRLLEESLSKNTDVKKLVEEGGEKDHDACKNRQHEFLQRTKIHLAAPAKRFIKAVNTLMVQLDRTKWADEVSKQYGDELLLEVQALYIPLEEAREYCLEALDDTERLEDKYKAYMDQKFELKCTCERVHKKYFEQQEENKKLRQQYQQQQQQQMPPVHIPTIVTTTPMPPPVFAPTMPTMMSSTPFHPPPVSQPVPNFAPILGQQQQGHRYVQPPGFNIYEGQQDQESRIPTPTAPSVINAHHHTRFKLSEELSLVEKFDGSQPRAYMAFRAQWSNFVEKMKMEERSNLDIYYALLKVLEGAAKDLVKTKYPNDQSYLQAIKKLDDLFYNPTNLLRDMVHNLLKNNKMSDSYESLLSGMTKLMDAWNDLNQADLTKDQLKGLLFVAATEKNLSEESWKCWLEVQNDPRFKQNPMEAFEISAYLGSIKKAMLNAQKRKNAIGAKEPSIETPSKLWSKSGKRQSTIYGSYSMDVNTMNNGSRHAKAKVQNQARGPNDTCIICGRNPHRYQLNCSKLRELTANQLYKIMVNAGIECQMCLALGHRTRECPAAQEGFLKKCTIKEDNVECGRYHCRFLHKPKKANEETANPKEE